MAASKRVLLATIGSLGDLHPMLALGLELRQRGHQVTVAATSFYRARIESIGLQFHLMRPDWDPADSEIIAQCEDLRTGPEILFRRLILPHLRDTYDDLFAAAQQADCLIAGEIVYAAPLVAEKLNLRWASAMLSPTAFFSAHDPSLLVNAPQIYRRRRAGPVVNRTVLELGKLAARHWWTPVRKLRRELGLNPDCDPLFRDKFSPYLVLALISRCMAQPQPDWPRQTQQPGFVFFDRAATKNETDAQLQAFLAAGPAPIVFTLGSAAVHNPGKFYETSLTAALRLGQRALLIGAKQTVADADALAIPYAPYSQVFPQAAAIVHQGGSGTTAQALRAGRPQLIVPYGWDQPDNGVRIARGGAGLTIERRAYTVQTASSALQTLLSQPRFTQIAAQAAAEIAKEDAVTHACNAIEAIL